MAGSGLCLARLVMGMRGLSAASMALSVSGWCGLVVLLLGRRGRRSLLRGGRYTDGLAHCCRSRPATEEEDQDDGRRPRQPTHRSSISPHDQLNRIRPYGSARQPQRIPLTETELNGRAALAMMMGLRRRVQTRPRPRSGWQRTRTTARRAPTGRLRALTHRSWSSVPRASVASCGTARFCRKVLWHRGRQ